MANLMSAAALLKRAAGFPFVSFRKVSKTFEVNGTALEAIHEFSLAIFEREFVAIAGSSGCGKSTLLRLLVGLNSESAGKNVDRRAAPVRASTQNGASSVRKAASFLGLR